MSENSDFIGVVINLPAQVEFNTVKPAEDGSFAVIPICGFYQISLVELRQDPLMQLFAMNTATQQIYRGELIEEDFGTEAPFPFELPELTPEETQGQVLAGYFNRNLTHYINLPAKEATYKVSVKIGQLTSNVVQVKVNLTQ